MQKTFTQKIYEVAERIPRGKVATYKDIARMAGNAKAARAVGTAMKNNPDMKIIPYHRVVASDGSMRGYAGKNGTAGKQAMLKKESVSFKGEKADLKKSRWKGR